jgi:hypothetical protein
MDGFILARMIWNSLLFYQRFLNKKSGATTLLFLFGGSIPASMLEGLSDSVDWHQSLSWPKASWP